jgi:hypothetical protein
VLHAIKRERALPAPSIALKRGTPRAGRDAGGHSSLQLRKLRTLFAMPKPPGSGVTSPARGNRIRSINRLSPVDAPR